jgi:hypothetical protein
MSEDRSDKTCPDCGDPVPFTFHSTSGVGAHKRGDNFNTIADTAHYICFPCGKAWKQRLDGPLTPDIVGDLAFFTCRDHSCGAAMAVTRESGDPVGVELTCTQGHRYRVAASDGGLALEPAG